MIIGKRFKFDAAHHLPNYDGKCKFTHGHTWTVDIELEGEANNFTGMVIDFADMDSIVRNVIGELDHSNLNNIMDNPTCERIVQFLGMKLGKIYGKRLYSIQVQEGDGGWARTGKIQ